MEDFFIVNAPKPCVSLFKKFYTEINRNSAAAGDDEDFNTFCLQSKTSTLRSIRNRTENCSVPDDILDSLVIVEELDRHLGVPPSDALKRAFCAVAVHRTLCWLPVSCDNYCDAVRRIWGKIIKDLEVSGTSGLLSPGLAEWRKEIEASLCDLDTVTRLLRINTLVEALGRIHVYLREFSGDLASAPTEGNGVNVVSASAEVAPSPSRSTGGGNVDNAVSASAEVAPSPRHSTGGGNVDNAVSASAEVAPSPRHSTGGGNGDNAASASAEVAPSPHRSTGEGNGDNAASASAEVSPSPRHSTGGGNVDNAASASAHVLSNPDHCKKKKNKILRVNSHTKHKLHSSRRRHKGIVITGLEEDWPSCPKDGFQSASEFNRLQQVPPNPMALALVDEATDSLSKALDTVDKARKSLKSSVVDLVGNVKDPLPKAMETAERIESYVAAARKVHSEGSEGNENKDQGAPNEAIRKDIDMMDESLLGPSEGNGNREQRAPDESNKYVDGMDESVLAPSGGDDSKEQGAPDEAVREDIGRMDENVLAPSGGNGNKEQGAPDDAVRNDIDMMDENVPAPSVDYTAEPSQAQEGNEAFTSPKKVCTSLMERNDTAHTFEWEDSIDVSPKVTDSCSNRRILPSLRTTHVSPLKIEEPKKWGRRRRVNRWTDEEEKALRDGVQRYGNLWKHILESNKEIFRDRTAVDLKDKWRNLLRK